jgi:glycosyltransferase involved in cell wall biosynthesis
LRPLILFLVGNMGNGGSERVMTRLLTHLDRRRFEPHLALLSREGPNLARLPSDVPVHELGCRSRSLALPLVLLCRKIRPAIIFSTAAHLNTALIACSRVLPGRPAIVVREGTILSRELFGANPLRLMIYRFLYRRADAVVCQSEDMLRDMEENFNVPAHKLVKIFNPVDVEELRRLAAEPDPYPPGDFVNLVAVGRLNRTKRYDFMFDALAALLRLLPAVKLHILGEGPLDGELRARTRAAGIQDSVVFHGVQENPFPFVRHADAYLLTSDHEGLPNALLEASFLGVPAVARNRPGGIRDIATRTPLLKLVESDTPEAFAKTVREVLEAPSNGASNTADTMNENFGIEPVMNQYHQLFSRFLS